MNVCDAKRWIGELAGKEPPADIGEVWDLIDRICGLADGLRKPTKEEFADARDQYQTHDIRINDNAMACGHPEGVWIQAWVYVYPVEEEDAA